MTFAHERVFDFDFKVCAACMGKKIKDSINEANTKALKAMGISFITSPKVPLIIREGIKANRVVIDAMVTGFAISFAPITAASFGGTPSSICCCTFSLTTMASSTMIPSAINTPTNEIILIV